jgi:hypothetical protein
VRFFVRSDDWSRCGTADVLHPSESYFIGRGTLPIAFTAVEGGEREKLVSPAKPETSAAHGSFVFRSG